MHINSENMAKKLGVGYIPKNRKENAIIPLMSILHNFSLATLDKFTKKGIVRAESEQKACEECIETLNIKVADYHNNITSLSGGNQQKVVLSKWLEADLKILIFDNPTQGVDVGAKAEIYSLIEQLAERGMAILVLSSEAQEIMKLCDKVHVMYRGRINGTLDKHEMSEESIMLLASVLHE